MDAIKPFVTRIVSRLGKEAVSETLAAFVARMVVYEHPERFPLDRPMTADAVDALVELCIKFLTTNTPSLATVRMQVTFDSKYFEYNTALQKSMSVKNARLDALQAEICAMGPEKTSDYAAMSSLYQLIFQYLAVHADVDPNQNAESEALREIAAALESVFPRVGLKPFVSLTTAEKANQLKELALLILGVRLFNKAAGRGGSSLPSVPETAVEQSNYLKSNLQTLLDETQELCFQFSDVILYAQIADRRGGESSLAPEAITRLKDELTNRRQFAAYVRSILSAVISGAEAIAVSADAYRQELEDLKRLVGARSSVPKEQVYPKFSSMASLWVSLSKHLDAMNVDAKMLQELLPYKESVKSTLTVDLVRRARAAKPSMGKRSVEIVREEPSPPTMMGASPDVGGPDADETEPAQIAGGDGSGTGPESKVSVDSPEPMVPGVDADAEDHEDPPVRLSVESTPEFLQLPLEYQGYCPTTIVTRGGLLLPGDPSLGVVRYRNRFYVFANEQALQMFLKSPRRYVQGITVAAKRAPELVQLLQLHSQFPDAFLPVYNAGARAPGAAGVESMVGGTRDVGVETPVHFVEKYIDPKYHWNEWELRRRALQLADLRHARTVSTQSDVSQFRRDDSTQVNLPVEASTQTGVSRGTNPPQMHRYITGLRGTGPSLPAGRSGTSADSAAAAAAAAGGAAAGAAGRAPSPDSRSKSFKARKDRPAAAVVTLTYDL